MRWFARESQGGQRTIVDDDAAQQALCADYSCGDRLQGRSLTMVAKAADHGAIQKPREIDRELRAEHPDQRGRVQRERRLFRPDEIEARIVQVHGPVADAETAKRQQADQVARLKASTDALRKELQRASSATGS